MGRPLRRLLPSWFTLTLLVGVALSASLMLLLLVAQGQFAGSTEVLDALRETAVRQSVFLSFWSASVSSLLALVLAVPTGLALARWKVPGMSLIEALLLIPAIMSPMALGVALLLVFRTEGGTWFQENLIQFVWEVPGILLVQFFVAYSFAVLVLRTTFAGIDVRLEQVARFLGCTRWQAFRRVTLPLARNGIIAAFVLGWARALGDFGATSMLAGGVPGKTATMPIAIYLNMARVSIHKAVALSIILSLVTIVGLITVRLLLGRGQRA